MRWLPVLLVASAIAADSSAKSRAPTIAEMRAALEREHIETLSAMLDARDASESLKAEQQANESLRGRVAQLEEENRILRAALDQMYADRHEARAADVRATDQDDGAECLKKCMRTRDECIGSARRTYDAEGKRAGRAAIFDGIASSFGTRSDGRTNADRMDDRARFVFENNVGLCGSDLDFCATVCRRSK